MSKYQKIIHKEFEEKAKIYKDQYDSKKDELNHLKKKLEN